MLRAGGAPGRRREHIANLQAKDPDATPVMYVCNCGRTFPGTLDGAWAAREHADANGHRLRVRRETPAPRAPTRAGARPA